MTIEARTLFTIGKSDQRTLRVQALTEDDDGHTVPLPGLAGATVVFSMMNEATGEVKVDAQPATVENAANAILQYQLTSANTNAPGVYLGDFYCVMLNGDKITVPTETNRKVRIIVTEGSRSGD